MRNRRHCILFALSLATMTSLAGCSADSLTRPWRQLRASDGPSRAVIFNDVQIPVSGVHMDVCTGEPFTFTGSAHESYRVTSDGAGGFHIGEHFNAQGIKGIGTVSGIVYTGTEALNLEFNGKYGIEQTIEHTFTAISHGPTPNELFHFLQHITINANGVVTVFFTDMRLDCNG